ncbi:MAG: site-2 protease family protein [Verrucomicrobiota bacterium]
MKEPGSHLGNAFGIRLYLHWTFYLLLAWVAFSHADEGWASASFAILFVSAIFICVLLHELGHSLAARAFGIDTHSITLYPIGGVARLTSMPRESHKEIAIALAGPAVNLAIVCLLVPLLFLFSPQPWKESGLLMQLGVSVAAGNIALFLFNLLPFFPMDGGRVLRALLSWKGSHVRATNIAARLGQVAALGFIGFGLFGPLPLSLAFIGVFLILASESERRLVRQFPDGPPSFVPPFDHEKVTTTTKTIVIHEDDWEVSPR